MNDPFLLLSLDAGIIVEDICLFRVLKGSNPLSVILRSFLTYAISMFSRQRTSKSIPIDLWLKLNKHERFIWRPGSVYDPFVYCQVKSRVHWDNGLESIFRFFIIHPEAAVADVLQNRCSQMFRKFHL